MATRYQNIVEHLDQKDEKDLRICRNYLCACNGCCGTVGAKKVTQRELDLYKSGEMQNILEKDK